MKICNSFVYIKGCVIFYHVIGVADPENSLLPIDGAVIIVTEQLTEVWSK